MTKIPIISQTALALSAGLLLTGCAGTKYEEPAYSSSAYESGDSVAQYSTATGQTSVVEPSGAQTIEEEIVIPLHEERVNVGKRTVDSGQVTIRKIITTETVNHPVQLRRETLIIDRGGSQQGSTANEPSGALRTENQSSVEDQSGRLFEEKTYTVRLREERPVIEKTIVQTGKVTAQKDSRMEQQNVSQQVRREDVYLDRSNAQNVEIRGNFKSAGQPLDEPAGAQPQKDVKPLDQQNNQAQPQFDDPKKEEPIDTP